MAVNFNVTKLSYLDTQIERDTNIPENYVQKALENAKYIYENRNGKQCPKCRKVFSEAIIPLVAVVCYYTHDCSRLYHPECFSSVSKSGKIERPQYCLNDRCGKNVGPEKGLIHESPTHFFVGFSFSGAIHFLKTEDTTTTGDTTMFVEIISAKHAELGTSLIGKYEKNVLFPKAQCKGLTTCCAIICCAAGILAVILVAIFGGFSSDNMV